MVISRAAAAVNGCLLAEVFSCTPPSCLRMSKSSWIETKRDADLDEAGRQVVKKVQLEPAGFTGKSKVDLVLRIIGMVAIVTPIILVYLQQKASLDTQKAIKQLDIYSITASELSSISRRPVNSAAFAASKEELIYNIPPKIAFLFSNEVSQEVEAINSLIPVYEAISYNALMIDSLFIHGIAAGSSLCSYREETVIAFGDSLDVAGHLNVMDSCRTELIYWLQELQSFPPQADTGVARIIQAVIALDTRMIKLHSVFSGYAGNANALLLRREIPSATRNKPVFDSLYSRHRQSLLLNKPARADYHALVIKIKAVLAQKIALALAHMRRSNRVFQDN